MAGATNQHPSFLGGEWSPLAQGRVDDRSYQIAMNVCRNGIPVEEGSWTRRPGSRLCGPTYKGGIAKLYPFFFTTTAPYQVEFTDGNIRFVNGTYPVITPDFVGVSSISTATPAVVTLSAPVAFSTDDEVAFFFSGVGITVGQNMRQRVFLITPVAETYTAWSSTTTYGIGDVASYGGTNYISLINPNLNQQPDLAPTYWSVLSSTATRTFSLRDGLTGLDIDGTTIDISGGIGGVYMVRSLRLTTPYTAGEWETARIVQNNKIGLILNGTNKPQAIKITPNAGSPVAASAWLKDARFIDGPYLDYVDNTVATVSGTTGSVSVTIGFQTWLSTKTYALGDYVKYGTKGYKSLIGGNLNLQPDTHTADWEAVDLGYAVTGPGSDTIGFQSTDVGRLIRLFSEPADWTATNYVAGNVVKYDNNYYVAINANASERPDLYPNDWQIDTNAATWTWGEITAVTNTYTVTVQINGVDMLYAGIDVRDWRLGVYSDTTGYPTCGTYCEGRFWFGGSEPDRFDASYVRGIDGDGNINMAPTANDGTVTDAHGISYYFEAKEQEPILWFEQDHLGILCGTKGGEWLIQASQLSEPFTPTSIQAHKITNYKCADIEPRKAGLALLFVQAFKRRIHEMMANVFTGKFEAPHLTEKAKHLTTGSIEELWYQEELAPIVWFRDALGKLFGTTYRRMSAFATEPPKFNGFHRHDFGHARTLNSIAVGPNNDGTLDALSMVTYDGTHYWIEQLTTLFDQNASILNAWFLDGGIVPDQYGEDTVNGVTGIRFTGLYYLAGKIVSVFTGGLDVGDFTVDANGTIFVPYGDGVDPLKYDFTAAGAGAWQFTSAYITQVLANDVALTNGGVNLVVSETLTSKTVAANPNGNTNKVQSYIGNTTTTRSDAASLDWGTGNFLMVDTGYSGFEKWNGVTGAFIAQYTMASYGYTTLLAAFDTDREGNVYFVHDSGNFGPMAKVADASMSLTFNYGAASSFGPPDSPGVVAPSAIAVAEANNPWVVAVGLGTVEIHKGTDGTFVSGNNKSTGAYAGVNQTAWSLAHNGNSLDAGAPTHNGNVASTYVVSYGSAPFNSASLYFIGVADGSPTQSSNSPNNGSTGKKGKGKKGASDGGVIHTPSVDNPLTFFGLIHTLVPTDIDSRWQRFNNCSGLVIDWSDNSMIFEAGVFTGDYSAWAATTVYGYDATQYANWLSTTTYASGDHAADTTALTNNTAVLYRSLQANNLNHALSDTNWWAVAGTAYFNWDAATAYAISDIVIGSDGNPYQASAATTGTDPIGDGGTHWTPLTTDTAGSTVTNGTRDDNKARFWYCQAINVLDVAPNTDAGGNPFPSSSNNWKEMPGSYIIAYQTGQYSRSNAGPNAVKWVVPVRSDRAISNQGRVHGGMFAYSELYSTSTSSYRIVMIDTTTGDYYVALVPGMKAFADWQAWDDQTQSFVLGGATYDSTIVGAPTGLNGTVSFSGQWARLYLGDGLGTDSTATSTLSSQPSTYTFVYNNASTAAASLPCVAGYTYTSQGQMLRPAEPQDSGSRNGPAMGKTRRAHRLLTMLHKTLGIEFGTEFTTKGMIRANLEDEETGVKNAPLTPFSGTWRSPLEDKYSFDSMVAWQIVRPYPATVVSIGTALHTQDM